ncbi:MAG: hypothetical protein EAZ35_02155 [Sphingobacteriia bacterium]|nr:MAG: hypothetical protein EAZ35_02155 [Sphingobacteriia bacterium]
MASLNKSFYEVHFIRLLRWNLPVDLRKNKAYVMLKALISPLMVTYNDFTIFRISTDSELVRTTQLCRLRGSLNDVVDKVNRRITITRGTGGNVLYVFTEMENNAKYLPKYLGVEGVNYIVYIPVDLQYKESIVRLHLTRYNLETLTYRIQYV